MDWTGKIGKLPFIKRFGGHRGPHEKKEKQPTDWIGSIYEWMGTLILSLICIIFAFIFFFRIVGVVGSSMLPTLIGEKELGNGDGDRLLVYTFQYKPKRGDIVIIDRYVEEPLVKRVIAVSGDTVEISEDGVVFVNNVQDEYMLEYTQRNSFPAVKQKVPEGRLFVLGDNRGVSKDSRDASIGFVNEKDVIGKAFFRFAPMDRWGFI